MDNYEQLLQELEAEIRLLEQKHHQFSLQKQAADISLTSRSQDSLAEEVHRLKQLVKENEILTGLTILEATSVVVEQDLTSSLRQHTISGEARGMQFKLQYDVREKLSQIGQKDPRAQILMLEMDVRDDMVALLQTELFSVAADVSVRELLQLLASYGAWVEDRERAINHFTATYPEIACRKEREDGCSIDLILRDPKQDLKFQVIWGLRVLPMKSVVPCVQLEVEASPEVLAKDQKGTLSSASSVFKLMCKKFGIERALHIMIKLLDDSQDQ